MTRSSLTLKYNDGQGTSWLSFPQKTSIGGDRTWLLIQCLALFAPSLSPCCPHSPALFLIIMCWCENPLSEIDSTPDKFLYLGPIPSIFFYSVTKAFLRYNLSSRHKIVPKNCTSVSCIFYDRTGVRCWMHLLLWAFDVRANWDDVVRPPVSPPQLVEPLTGS